LIVTSLATAATTVAIPLAPCALHVSFLRAARADRPLELSVSAVHDGRRTAHRRVEATQDDRPVASASLRFTAAFEASDWHATTPPMCPPEAADSAHAAVAAVPAMAGFEIRGATIPEDGRPVIHPYWVRHRHPLPSDPLTHAGLVAFIGVSGSARRPVTRLRHRLGGVTLDHSLWWHRHARADEWLLVTATSTSESAGRAYARGEIATRDGVLVASFAQDALSASTPL
jgi:acyl-CoA thioesterase-2